MGGLSVDTFGGVGVRREEGSTEGQVDLRIYARKSFSIGDSLEPIISLGVKGSETFSGTPRFGGSACVSGGVVMIGMFTGVCGGVERNFDRNRFEFPVQAFLGGVAPVGNKAFFMALSGGVTDVQNPGFQGGLVFGGSASYALFGK